MDVDTIYKRIAEILEEDDVDASVVFENCEVWDSLAALSIIALMDSSCGVMITAEELNNLKTVGELLSLVELKQSMLKTNE
ncbi:acyl carrier protein [Thermodesulfobacteriota bacterium]